MAGKKRAVGRLDTNRFVDRKGKVRWFGKKTAESRRSDRVNKEIEMVNRVNTIFFPNKIKSGTTYGQIVRRLRRQGFNVYSEKGTVFVHNPTTGIKSKVSWGKIKDTPGEGTIVNLNKLMAANYERRKKIKS